MKAAPKIMTATEAEEYKKKKEEEHAKMHAAGIEHTCKHHFEEHHDKILVIEKRKTEEPIETKRKKKGMALNPKLFKNASQLRELKK